MKEGSIKSIREIKQEIKDVISRDWTRFIFKVANYTSTDENIINTDLEINIYCGEKYIDTVYCGVSCKEIDNTLTSEGFWEKVENQRKTLSKDKKRIYNALVKSYSESVVKLSEDYCQ